MQQSGMPAPGRVQEVLDRVLAQPEFQYAGTSPLMRWIQAALDFVGRLFERWWPALGDSQVRFLSWLLLGVTVAFGGYLVTRWILGRRPTTRSRRGGDVSLRSEPLDSAGWGEWARDKARAGRLREAATGRYQSAILHLDSRGVLRYREWKTPGDYALEMSDEEALRAPFLDFLGRFVEAAFGPHEPTPEAFESLSAGAKSLGCPI